MADHPAWRHPTRPESRRILLVVQVAVIAAQSWIAHSLHVHPFWLLPAITAVLLAASMTVYERLDEPSRQARVLSLAVSALLVLTNAVNLALLVYHVFVQSSLSSVDLLLSGVALWIVNLGVFALVYWELDGGGPESRAAGYPDRFPDLVFPQQQGDQPDLARDDWKPSFHDYLYVSLTDSFAFSPTDTMPYTGTAKLVMGVESIMSFAIAAVLVARAVNIATG